MAAPSYTTDLATIDDATTVVSWDESSDGAWDDGSGTGNDTDYYISDQSAGGTPQCISQEVKFGAGKSGVASMIADYGSGITWTSGDCAFFWQFFAFGEALDSYANGGQRCIIGTGLGDFKSWDTGGNDRSPNPYGGWYNIAVDPDEGADDTVGSPGTSHRYFGCAVALTTGIAKGNPFGADIIRYGRGDIQVEYGDVSNGYATFAGMAAANDTTAARWGLFQGVAGGYLWKGRMLLGTSSNAVDFRDATATSITIDDTPKVSSSFNAIVIDNASSNIEWTGHRFFSLGTQSSGTITVNAAATLKFSRCTFENMGSLSFSGADATNSYFNDCFFTGCGEVTAGSTVLDFSGSSFLESSVDGTSTDIAAFVWGSTTDPGTDGDLDNTNFTKGTNSHHAIEFSNATASTYSLDNCDFSGFNSSDNEFDSTFYVAATSGTVTINIANCTGNFTYKSAGASVNIVINPVTLEVSVYDLSTGDPVEDARVLAYPTNDSNFPYMESVTPSGSGTTASIYHVGHPFITGDNVIIAGAEQDYYNGAYEITVDGDRYTYTTNESIGVSPATGDVSSTFAFLNELTTASGLVSETKSLSSDQSIAGWVRKSSASPYYAQGNISGTIDSDAGLNITVQLVGDE